MHHPNQPDYRRLFLAIFLAAIVLTVWQAFFEWPRRQQLAAFHAEEAKIEASKQVEYAKTIEKAAVDPAENPNLSRAERLQLTKRLPIVSEHLHGSIALKGARFDDLTLVRYRETIDPQSPEVVLFSPSGNKEAYAAQIGWLAGDHTIVPDHNSLWQADGNSLTPDKATTLRWDNGHGVTFEMSIRLDDAYMFTIEQRLINHSDSEINVIPYAYINRAHDSAAHKTNVILHEGPMGIIENALKEIPYSEIRDKGNQTFGNSNGWFGMTDKYWLAAIIPSESGAFKSTYSYYQKNMIDRYQVDYLGTTQAIAPKEEYTNSIRLFAGAKEIDELNAYTSGSKGGTPIPLLDRAVDFGALYFLTKPLFLLLNFFYKLLGNFGLAILALTFVVKLCLFPLANAGYKSAAQMRRLQPKMTELKDRHGDDRITFQKELMSLYKQEKVNPASGCLPILIQMPVFFALYKVLFVTIEMRHAPFFGWIKDLSAMDSSNIFTLFGLIAWTPPSALHLGILPIVMCATMVIQMRQQPTPPDPVQAKIIKFMPYMFLFMFASFPAGLVIYWICSNTLSIIQQQVISRRHGSLKKT